MPCSLPFWPYAASADFPGAGACAHPGRGQGRHRIRHDPLPASRRRDSKGKRDGDEPSLWRNGKPSEPLPTTKGELAARLCQELDAPLTRQARHSPSHSLATQRLHSPIGSARGLLTVNSVTISQPQQEQRQEFWTSVLWPVVVKAGASRYPSHAVDSSTHR